MKQQPTPDSIDLNGLIEEISTKGIGALLSEPEIKNACLAHLDELGCRAPKNHLLLFALVKLAGPAFKFAGQAISSNIVGWLQTSPKVAKFLSALAHLCRVERDKEKLKDLLKAELLGNATPQTPLTVDEGTALNVVQALHSRRQIAGLGEDMRGLFDALSGAIATLTEKVDVDKLALLTGWPMQTDAVEDQSLVSRIKYNSGAYPLIGREAEIEMLKDFLGSPVALVPQHRFRWLLLTGDGGEGKTRLAMEFTRHHLPEGWTGGRLPMEQMESFITSAPDWYPRKPTLIVIDYPAQAPADVYRLMQRLQARAKDFDHPVRILMLERDASDSWFSRMLPTEKGDGDVLREAAHVLGGQRLETGLRLLPLHPGVIVEMMAARLAAVGHNDIAPDALYALAVRIDPRFYSIEIEGEMQRFAFPRALLAAAAVEWLIAGLSEGQELAALLAHPAPRSDVLKSLLKRDRTQFWQPVAGQHHASLDKHENLLALANFTLGLNVAALDEATLPKSLATRFPAERSKPLLDAMTDLAEGRLAQLEPDLLGEYHLIDRTLALRDDPGRHAIADFATLAYNLGGDEAAIFALRAARDYPAEMAQLDWLCPTSALREVGATAFAGFCGDLVPTQPIEVTIPLFTLLARVSDSFVHQQNLPFAEREAQALVNLASGIGKAGAWDQLAPLYARYDALTLRFAASEAIAVDEAKALKNLAAGFNQAGALDRLPRLFDRYDALAARFGGSEAIAVEEAQMLGNLVNRMSEAEAWERWDKIKARATTFIARLTGNGLFDQPRLMREAAFIFINYGAQVVAAGRMLEREEASETALACCTAIVHYEDDEDYKKIGFAFQLLKHLESAYPDDADITGAVTKVRGLIGDEGFDQIPPLVGG
jgi:hypothetical protein